MNLNEYRTSRHMQRKENVVMTEMTIWVGCPSQRMNYPKNLQMSSILSLLKFPNLLTTLQWWSWVDFAFVASILTTSIFINAILHWCSYHFYFICKFLSELWKVSSSDDGWRPLDAESFHKIVIRRQFVIHYIPNLLTLLHFHCGLLSPTVDLDFIWTQSAHHLKN